MTNIDSFTVCEKVLKLLETLNTMNLINNRLRAQFNLLRSNNAQPHYNKYGPHRQCSYRYQSLQFTLLAVADWPSPKTSADSSMLTSDIGCQHWIGRSLEMSPKMSIRLLRFGHKPRGHVLHSQTEARLCDQCETNKLSVDWWRSGAAVHAAATQRNTTDFILNITDDTK